MRNRKNRKRINLREELNSLGSVGNAVSNIGKSVASSIAPAGSPTSGATNLFGDVYDEEPTKRRAGDKFISQIDDKKIIDLFDKIMLGGFWLSPNKGSEEEILAYQKFLQSADYDVRLTGKYDDLTRDATEELQKAIDAEYENYNDPKFKADGIFGKASLKMLIAGLRNAKTQPTLASFKNNIFPNATTGVEVIKWLVDHYDKIGTGRKKKSKRDIEPKGDDSTLEGTIKNQGHKDGRKLYSYERAFFNKYPKTIIQAANETNSKIFPSVSIAQAALETGYGKHTPGGNSNNLFGIKAFPREIKAAANGSNPYWDGSHVNSKTKEEYKPGEISNIKSNFRMYKSEIDSCKDHDLLLNTSSLYKDVRSQNNVDDQVDALHASPYATDNEYDIKLHRIIANYNLKKYDKFGPRGKMMTERKKIMKSFIKILLEQELGTGYDATGKFDMEADAQSRSLYNVLDGQSNNLLGPEKNPEDLIDNKKLLMIKGDNTYLYALDIKSNQYFTIKYKNFKPEGGNKWISLSAPKYRDSVSTIKKTGIEITSEEAVSIKKTGKSVNKQKTISTPPKISGTNDIDFEENELIDEPGYYDITFGPDGNPSVPAMKDLAKAIKDELGITVTSLGRGPEDQARVSFQYAYGLDALVRKYDPSIAPGSYYFADHPQKSTMLPKVNAIIVKYKLGSPVKKGVYRAYNSKTYQSIFNAYEKGKDFIQQAGVRGGALQRAKGRRAGEEFWSGALPFWTKINKRKAKNKETGHATGYALDISPRTTKSKLQKVADKFGLTIKNVKFEADHNHVNVVNKAQKVTTGVSTMSENKKIIKEFMKIYKKII